MGDTEGEKKRKLASIMFLDMVSYSAMMAKDEQETLLNIRALEVILRKEVEAAQGRLIKFLGDGSLSEFPTASAAVGCAQKIQESLAKRNHAVKPHERYRVRIGINLGEVYDDGVDLYGDAVNIAARLQALALPGETVVSDFVYMQIRNKISCWGVSIPNVKLKNIPEKQNIFIIPPPNVTFSIWAIKRGGYIHAPSMAKGLRFAFVRRYGISILAVLLILLMVGMGGFELGQKLFADPQGGSDVPPGMAIEPGMSLESWEEADTLAWAAEDSTVVMQKTAQMAVDGKQSLVLQLDFAKYGFPKLSARLGTPWDLGQVEGLIAEVYVPRGIAGTMSAMPMAGDSMQKLHYGRLKYLQPGWNKVPLLLKDAQFSARERRHVTSVGWMLFCDNKQLQGWVAVDNLRAIPKKK